MQLSLRDQGLASLSSPPLPAKRDLYQSVDLSSNAFLSMSTVLSSPLLVHSLSRLVELNLACNQIDAIDGLASLVNLHRLILSFNNIHSLHGLADISSPYFYYCDLKGNRIAHFDQLYYLAHLKTLKELVLKGSDALSTLVNPICKDTHYGNRVHEILPQVLHLDNPYIQSFPDLEAELDTTFVNESIQGFSSPPRHTLNLPRPMAHPQHQLSHPPSVADTPHRLHTVESRLTTAPPPPPVASENAHMIQYFQAVLDKLDRTAAASASPAAPSLQTGETERVWALEERVAALSRALEERENVARLQDHAMRVLGKGEEQLVDGEESVDEREEVIPVRVSSRIPKLALGESQTKKLVWKTSTPAKSASPPALASAASPDPAPSSPQNTVARILDALEREKETMKAKEARYAAEIVSLNQQLDATLKRAEEDVAMRKSAAEKVQALESAAGLLAENHALVLADVNRRVEEEVRRREVTEARCVELNAVVEVGKKELEHMQMELTQLREALVQSESDKDVLAKRFLKDRDAARMSRDETSRELDVYRRTIKKLQKSKADLEGAVSKLTEHHSKNVEALKDSHAKELKDSVAKAVTESATRNKADLDKVHRDLNTANRAREVLELEMRNATKAEHQKYSDLFKAFQELAEDSKELSKMLKETTKSEQDLRAVARELTNVVKDQKLKIVELVNKNEASFSIFEEKCLAMEGQLKTLNEAKERLEALKQDLAVCRSDLVNAQAHVDALQAEKAAIEITGAEQMSGFQVERDCLMRRVTELEHLIQTNAAAKDEVDQVLRIKVKMLDDQNDTIRVLKQNLENKTRDHTTLLQDWNSKEGKLCDSISKERKRVRDLTDELTAQAEAFENLQLVLQDCKQERDTLHAELVDVSAKLQERNASIAHIEQEVSRVRSVFAAKELKLVQERDDALASREVALDDLRRHYENQMGRLKVLERERNSLFETTKRLKVQVEELESTKESQQDEVKHIMQELDKQKQKFIKLKEAIDF